MRRAEGTFSSLLLSSRVSETENLNPKLQPLTLKLLSLNPTP